MNGPNVIATHSTLRDWLVGGAVAAVVGIGASWYLMVPTKADTPPLAVSAAVHARQADQAHLRLLVKQAHEQGRMEALDAVMGGKGRAEFAQACADLWVNDSHRAAVVRRLQQ